jgi:hypothetical protein
MIMSSPSEGKGLANGFGVGPVLWLSLAAIFIMSIPNLIDPMMRHDDFPALFGDGDMFWFKTLHEGRWVNYLWHLRGYLTPAWLNFAIYQGLWALFAASLANVVIRQEGLTFYKGALALLILVSPSALLISLWFNTLLPGLCMVAVFGLLACRVSNRTLTFLLPVFTVLTFMAYTTYPLLLLAIYLFRQDQRSIPKLIAILAFFTTSFIAAILLTYTVNWSVHGVFGVPLAEWREATPAHSLQGLLDNLPKLWGSLGAFMDKTSFGLYPAQLFHIILLVGSAAVLFRHEPMEALYLYAGLITGLSLIVLQVLKLGVSIPPRTFLFAWVFYGIAVVRAAEILVTKHAFAGRMAANAVLLIVGSYLLQSFMQFTQYRAWQSDTRVVANELRPIEGPVFVTGKPMDMIGAKQAGIQADIAFQFRVQQLIGRDVVMCDTKGIECPEGVDIEPTSTPSDGAPAVIAPSDVGTIVIFK